MPVHAGSVRISRRGFMHVGCQRYLGACRMGNLRRDARLLRGARKDQGLVYWPFTIYSIQPDYYSLVLSARIVGAIGPRDIKVDGMKHNRNVYI